jgi:hypothetical protein
VLRCLRGDGVTLTEVLRQYHARGVVSLWRRPLRLCEMTADRAPWTGTVTASSLLSPLEVQRCVVQGGRPTRGHRRGYSRCSPTRGLKKFVSHCLLYSSHLLCVFVVMSIFSETFCSD